MSTDTMYFNSSRLMSASSKNKTNSITRLDKKRTQAERKNKVRQETIDPSIPQPQVLPNGEKPDFGNSGSRRKQRQNSSTSNKQDSSSQYSSKLRNEDNDADQVAQSLKELFLQPEKRSGTKNERKEKKEGPKRINSTKTKNSSLDAKARTSSSSSSSSFSVSSPGKHSSASSTPPMYAGSPPAQVNNVSSNQYPNPVSSPLFMRPGLYPTQPPSSAPQHQPQHLGHVGYPYGNYSLTSPTVTPQFMKPQAPLINPMYPQVPLNQLPLMYQALDIQQQQQHQQYQHHQQQLQHQQYQQQQQHHQQYQQYQQPQQQFQYQPTRPLSAAYPASVVPKSAEPVTNVERKKQSKSEGKRSSKSFAGASFASKDPKVHKLPKPSFA